MPLSSSFRTSLAVQLVAGLVILLVIAVGGVARYSIISLQNHTQDLRQKLTESTARTTALELKLKETQKLLAETAAQLLSLQNQDQIKINQELISELKHIHDGYKETVAGYDELIKLRNDTTKTQALDADFASVLNFLSDQNYASAAAKLASLEKSIQKTREDLIVTPATVLTDVPTNNSPPNSGYQHQVVESDVGKFAVDLLGADLSNTKVVAETASSGDCADHCPVSSLADFIAKAGGYAGVNGPYFCPAEYPSCVGKTNSFDTLMMNRQKTYFNSANNIYSSVPAVIFSGGSARFVGASAEWGRDTGPDAVIAAQPMLLSAGQLRFGGDGDPKKGNRGNRSFIGTKGNKVYIGVVKGASVAEVAHVLKTLGLDNALNLDSGGSVAFMVNGKYVDGPGRQTPFGIVLVRK